MTFTSLEFIAFCIVVAAIYFAAPSKSQKYILLVASLFFYYQFGIIALLLMLLSAAIGFAGGLIIDSLNRSVTKKIVLTVIIFLELLILVGLKYCANITSEWGLVIPIGLSFYTLSIIGYCFDVYRSDCAAEKNPFLFLLFVTYFPHILQGPIPRFEELCSQFREENKDNRRFNYDRVAFGIQLMLWGYIKKLVIADRLGIFINAVYGNTAIASGTIVFLAVIFYPIQLYMDFSGCVDIAMGFSEALGIELAQNFRQPYLATSINDYWKRWHISLSSWFKDYVYIPLGGNRKGKIRRWMNVFIVFVLSGVWHGVGATYLVWGLLQAIYQLFGSLIMPLRKLIRKMLGFDEACVSLRCVRIIGTYILISISTVFFRLSTIEEAVDALRIVVSDIRIWEFFDGTIYRFEVNEIEWQMLILFMLFAVAVDIIHEKGVHIRFEMAKQPLVIRWLFYISAFTSIVILGVYGQGFNASNFLYMNF